MQIETDSHMFIAYIILCILYFTPIFLQNTTTLCQE